MRVHELAKLAHRSSKDIVTTANSLGIDVAGAMSALSPADADRILSAVLRQPAAATEAHPTSPPTTARQTPPRGQPSPLMFTPTQTRPQTARHRVKADTLSAMARTLMSDSLRGTPTLRAQDAEQLEAEALQWAREGFDATSVRAWHASALPPSTCGYLARRGVSPDVLTLTLPSRFDRDLDVATALWTQDWTVEQVYDLLVATGLHTPAPEPAPLPQHPPAPHPARSAAPPVLFSSPSADGTTSADFPHDPHRQPRPRRRPKR